MNYLNENKSLTLLFRGISVNLQIQSLRASLLLTLKTIPMKKQFISSALVTTLIFFIFSVVPAPSRSQNANLPAAEKPFSPFNIGIGFGLDYGGIGVSLNYIPIKQLGIFGGLGYNILGLGYNIGAAYRILPAKRFCPSLSAMYGYNAVISVEEADSPYDKTYYGPTFGANLEWHGRKKTENYFKLSLLLPIRPQAYTDDLDKLKNDPNYEVKMEPWPVTFSIGYHFGL
jgi:hypothetical protein